MREMVDGSRLLIALQALAIVRRDLATAPCHISVAVLDPRDEENWDPIIPDRESWLANTTGDDDFVLLVINASACRIDQVHDLVGLVAEIASLVQDAVIDISGKPWPQVLIDGRERVLDAAIVGDQAAWTVHGEPQCLVGQLAGVRGGTCDYIGTTPALTEQQKASIRARAAQMEADPSIGLDWDDVYAELMAELA